jgi:hypothetical protein
MTVISLHQPESTVDTNSDSQSPKACSIDFTRISNYTLLYIPALAWALKNLQIPHPGEAALFLSQLAFWFNTESGHCTRDGRKWIYNSYSDWVQQIPSLTEYQFGVMIRSLVFHELIEKSCYASLRKQLTTHPVSWHPDNTSSWITLNIERIIELTNWHPFGKQNSTDNDQTPEPAREAEIVNPTSGDCKSNFAKLGTQFSSIYIEDSISTKDGETSREKEQINYSPDPWIDQQEDNFSFDGLKSESSVKTQDSHEGQFSAPPPNTNNTNTTNHPKGFGATNNTNTTQKAQRNVSNKIEAPLPKLKSEEIDRPLFVWEEALNRPNPYFLQWWAKVHYEPQGGKWKSGARLFAKSQFYNDPVGADIIYQEYLLFMDTVANNANQQQNQKIQAILPSCFVKYPEVNQENKEQLAKNIATIAARGAGVAIPGNVAPGSTQHMSLEEASNFASIKPLPKLEQPALPGTGQQQDSIDLEKLTKQVEFANKKYHEYKDSPANARWFREITSWAKHTPGVVITESGISLETYDLQQPHTAPQ